jgi:hypothetical protein
VHNVAKPKEAEYQLLFLLFFVITGKQLIAGEKKGCDEQHLDHIAIDKQCQKQPDGNTKQGIPDQPQHVSLHKKSIY